MNEQEKITIRLYKISYLIGFVTGTLLEIVDHNDDEIPDYIKCTLHELATKLLNGMEEFYD